MSDDHWENFKQIFHAVVALTPKEREAYLNSACRGDDAMRLKIESLIEHHEKANNFVDLPAYQAAAEMLIDDQEFKPGQTLSHYEIHSLLGVGGMGKVYLAADTQLSRQVALKLLPAEFTSNKDRVRRFQQEARAASALNHPNIVTIYEIGQAEERHFIAAEFIDGETLRQRLNRSPSHIVTIVGGPPVEPLQLSEVLSVGMQVVDALAAAHAKGIVHRDVKPENIILIRDGHLMQKERVVKVLDFGIAKLTHEDVDVETKSIGGEPATRALLSTLRGSIVGTVRYMSPEQARGESVDLRTDIWSLGVVLYEMLSDRVPFSGDTAPDVIASILKTELPPLSVEVPERLRWIVAKALRKDRAERYQTAKEIFADLRDFQRHPDELKGTAQRAVAAEVSSEEQGTSSAAVRESRGTRAASTARGERRSASTLGYLPNRVKRFRGGAFVGLAALVITGAVIALTLPKFVNHQPPDSANKHQSEKQVPARTMKMAKLTSTGKAADAAISPDGKYLAYVKDENAQQSLWLQQTSIPGSGVQLLPPSGLVLLGLRFSDDGKYIYYQVDKNAEVVELFRLPLLGGIPQKLITDIDSVATFSPDGRRLAFLRGYPLRKETTLVLANVDGSGEQILVTRDWVNGFSTGVGTAAWSPDGSVIVCPVTGVDGRGRYSTLLAVGVADKTEKLISSQRFWQVRTIAWLRDGSGLVFTARERMAAPSQIWYLSFPAGVARRITNEINDYSAVSITADSASVVAVVSDQVSNIWIAPHDDARRANQITSDRVDGAAGMAWTPGGQIVYASRTSGNLDLWIVAADGTGQKQLTADAGNNNWPSVSADGRYVVFVSDRTGGRHLWRIDLDGRNARELTNGEDEFNPHCSPTESLVAYDQGLSLYKVSLDGGQPMKIIGLPSPAVISPDGQWVTGSYVAESNQTAIYSLAGGEPRSVLDIPPWLDTKWTPDGTALAYIDNKNMEINSRPITGGPPMPLINFAPDLIFDFAWSRDGKQLAVARGTLTHDVVMISDFRDSQ